MDSMIPPSAVNKAFTYFCTNFQASYQIMISASYRAQSQKPVDFFDLPPEIRLQIYTLYFSTNTFPNPYTIPHPTHHPWASPLMNTSHRLRIDAASSCLPLHIDFIKELKCKEHYLRDKVRGFERKHGSIKGKEKIDEYKKFFQIAGAAMEKRKWAAKMLLSEVKSLKERGALGGDGVAEMVDWLFQETWRE